MPTIAERIDQFVADSVQPDLKHPELTAKPDPIWEAVRQTGTQLWLDTGDMDAASKLWTAEFSALTTNNTLLNKEVQKGGYDKLVRETARILREENPDATERELLLEIAFVLNAHHGLRLVKHFGCNVSVELHTDLADDLEASVAYGRRYFALCPERFYVKIPLTPAGFLAARRLAAEGIPINFTLGFSARQNYVAARLTRPNFVNVFLGRLNAVVANNDLGDGENVGEKTTLATMREMRALRQSGGGQTRLIAASMREGGQVETLAGVDVMTMPTKVAAQYHDKPASGLRSRVDDDPEVALKAGVKLEDFAGQTLWEVPAALKQCVDALLKKDLDALTPDALVEHFAEGGFPDLLPRWSAADHARAAEDGKVPVIANWRERLAGGEVGLDALMNLSGYHSFASDQKAFDDHVRGLI